MRKLFIIALLLFIITTCIGCSDNPSTNVAAYEPITNEVYTQIQDVEEVQPTIVYITATGKKYHKENCQYLKYTKCRTFLEDAIDACYMPCSVCKP